MTLRNIAAASLAALALAACGDDDDDNNTKPITPDTPAIPEACKAMKCTLQTEGEFKGSFVTKNEKGQITAVWDAKGNQTHKLGKDGKLEKIENKPEPGKTAGEFDLSGEGVNEPIAQNVRGGGIYIRGSNSKHDLKKAPKADLSPIGQFGLETDWDETLQNNVIARIRDAAGNEIGAIGVENIGKKNANGDANADKNGYTAVWAVNGTAPKGNGKTPASGTAFTVTEANPAIEMNVKNPTTDKADIEKNGSIAMAHNGTVTGTWKNEEQAFEGPKKWDGADPIRLYGNKAWYLNNFDGTSKTSHNIFRIADYGKVVNQAVLKNGNETDKYGVLAGQDLPTNIAYDTLNYVQFGRVSANVSSLNDAGPEYGFPGLQFANRANSVSNAVSTKGDPNATDFYFARGNNPTKAEDIKALPSTKIGYHGNALVFGLSDDFHGGKTAAAVDERKSLPHSFGKGTVDKTKQTLLGGRGNFVYAEFDPAKSKVEGSIYNVWLIGTYKPEWDATGKKWTYYKVNPLGDDGFEKSSPTDALTLEQHVKDVFAYKDDLIQFEGKVAGNAIRGDAVNYAAQKGKFAGAFFGKNAEEMSGVITSNTEAYGKPDEAPHWGAVFGAKTVTTPLGETLPAMGGSNTSWLHEEKGSK